MSRVRHKICLITKNCVNSIKLLIGGRGVNNRDVCEREEWGLGGSILIKEPGVSKINTLLEPRAVGLGAGGRLLLGLGRGSTTSPHPQYPPGPASREGTKLNGND